ncbi:GLPGLI family protein [Hanstruepera marina]|uniref:GLPGLI family protein n=1 Tax=Hanstruepera marina TaxID=2873265 RepID=UPI001CA5F5DB|nr:GLPGLI family protein [Hanstruepera marina]
MIRIKILPLLIVLILVNTVQSQDLLGIATYISKKKLDMKLDTTKYDVEMRNKLSGFFEKQFQKTSLLIFNTTESNYKEESNLSTPNTNKTTESLDLLYKDLKSKRFVHRKELLGKNFLIKDSISMYNWSITSETKNIGNYLCYKATSVIKKKVLEDKEIVLKDVKIEAWFTLQIPIGNGPGYYNGLPGLILEVNDDDYAILCSKVVLNSGELINIKEPKGGKKVNLKEFELIELEKRKEGLDRAKIYLMGIESDRNN